MRLETMIDDISDILHDPDFETEFVLEIKRTERHENGRLIESTDRQSKFGVIQPASLKETQYLDEGDRNKQSINIWSDEYLSAVDNICPQLGDIVEWHCRRYRVVAVKDWSEYGYWKALAVELIRGQTDV